MLSLEQMLDKARISEKIHAYCRFIDRGDYELLRTVYHPDAIDEHGQLFCGGVEEFIEHARKSADGTGISCHNITTTNIELEGNVANTEAYFIAIHQDMPDGRGGRTDMLLGGRYLDRFEQRDGEWRIAHRLVVFDWNSVESFASRWDDICMLWRPRGQCGPTDASYLFLRKN